MENKYCVYLHKNPSTGEVFYVGEGTLRRPYASCKYTRSSKWREIVDTLGGFDIEIVNTNLSKKEALELEKELIQKYNVINSSHQTGQHEISSDEFKTICNSVRYSGESPSGLIWKKSGRPAGSKFTTNGKSYWRVQISGKTYRIHRIIKMIEIGSDIPYGSVVNHLDGNGLNNTITNLEICSQKVNMREVNTRNTTSQGVKYNKISNAWVAYWQEDCKTVSKSFSVAKYGDLAFDMAYFCRKQNTYLGSLVAT